MKRFITLLLLALVLSAPAHGADMTIRGGTHSPTLNSGDSFLFQRNPTGPYFYINKSEIPAALGLSTGNISGYVAPVNADWNSVSGLSQILNKPTSLSAFINDLNLDDMLPDQSGHAGEFLTTDGSVSSWDPAANNLSALGDTNLGTLADKNLLKYDSGTGKWVNGTIAWGEVTGKPSFATVATSGQYGDLLGLPDLSLTLTGDVNGTGTGNVATTIKDSVTLPKFPQLFAGPFGDVSGPSIANAAYVWSSVHGIPQTTGVRVVQETSPNLIATYNNGTAGVGATLTNAGAQAALVIDGVTMNVDDDVLLDDQDDGTQNGWFTVTAAGDSSHNWVLTRSANYDTIAEIEGGVIGSGLPFLFKASEGTQTNKVFALFSGPNNIHTAIGTSPLFYGGNTNINGYVARDGFVSGHILVGDSDGVGQSVAMSGDCSISNAGSVTCTKSSGTDLTALFLGLHGTADAATSLAANGTNCSAGSYPLGVDAAGNAEGCTVAASGTVTAVSVATANGVSGSSSGGATPALTINLGAITPSTVNGITLSGSATPTLAVTGTTSVSGANTGDQDLSGLVPTTRTVNGHALSGNINVTASDVGLGSVENTALSTWAGSTNMTTVGTIATGTWHATAIGDSYISSASAWNAKAASGANTDITSLLLNQTGLVVKGGDANALTIKPNETETAGRTLNLKVHDADRTVDLSGNLTVLSAATISGTNTGDQTSVSGNAGTATALAANGSNCSAGSFPLGVDASGASESCTAIPTTITGTSNQVTASASTGAITLSTPQDIAPGSSPQFAGVNVGNATDTTITRVSAGVIAVEGATVLTGTKDDHVLIGFSATSPTVAQQGAYVTMDCAGTITSYDISADAGTATIKFWKSTSSTAAPTSANSINTSGFSLSSNTHIHSTSLSDLGANTTFNSGDTFGVEVTAVATAARLSAQLNGHCN